MPFNVIKTPFRVYIANNAMQIIPVEQDTFRLTVILSFVETSNDLTVQPYALNVSTSTRKLFFQLQFCGLELILKCGHQLVFETFRIAFR